MPAHNRVTERRLGRPPDVDSAATRARLLIAARAAFARDGYGNATNKDIAAAAGITPAAIYHYFPSKADLYMAVVEGVQQGIQQTYDRIATQVLTLRERFEAMLSYAVEANRRDHTGAAFMMGVYTEAQLHPELREPIRALRRRSVDVVAKMVADAVRCGELGDDIDPQALEDLMNAVFVGLRRLSANPDRGERHARAVALLRLLIAGGVVNSSST